MYIENGKTVRKMPVKLGDGQTIWADCVDLNQKDTNNSMVMEFDNNLNNSNDGLAPDQNNSVMNQQNRPMQQNMVSKNHQKKIIFSSYKKHYRARYITKYYTSMRIPKTHAFLLDCLYFF